MSAGFGAGAPVRTFPVSSNRAPFYSDANVDSNLLAAGASKTITPKYNENGGTVDGIGMQILIVNSSGQPAQITLTIARNYDGSVADTMPNPLTLPDGSTLPLANLRVLSILEKNTGSLTQSGNGVEYFVVMEPTR